MTLTRVMSAYYFVEVSYEILKEDITMVYCVAQGKLTFTRAISTYYFIDESMGKNRCTFKRLDYKKSAKYKELKNQMNIRRASCGEGKRSEG